MDNRLNNSKGNREKGEIFILEGIKRTGTSSVERVQQWIRRQKRAPSSLMKSRKTQGEEPSALKMSIQLKILRVMPRSVQCLMAAGAQIANYPLEAEKLSASALAPLLD